MMSKMLRSRLARLACAVTATGILMSGCGRSSHSVTSTGVKSGCAWVIPTVGSRADYVSSEMSVGSARSQLKVSPTQQESITVAECANHGRSLPSYVVATFDIREDIHTSMGPANRDSIVITWIGMDRPGNCYLLGVSFDGSTWDTVTDTDPPKCAPSELHVGDSWGYEAHLASGQTISQTNTCEGTETVETGIGRFEAYKVKYQGYARGIRMSGFNWMSPAVPAVFSLKSQDEAAPNIHGMTMPVHTVSTLSNLNLAR